MNHKNASILVEISDISNIKEFGELTNIRMDLGGFKHRIHVEDLKKTFKIIKFLTKITKESDYAFFECKVNESSPIVYTARVPTSELECVTESVVYKIPEDSDVESLTTSE